MRLKKGEDEGNEINFFYLFNPRLKIGSTYCY